ncbi:hypothetical protein KY345_06180 [Candidatus Woesearchaeota archaeon]|nr:hypothetical protein [Candidatus Woesearchaeota archaeon]
MVTYVEFFELLESYGLTDALLPFLLIFTIVFAILQKTNILGAGRKNFNVIVALVLALTAVIPHVTDSYPEGYDVIEIMNTALPQVSLIAVAAIMLMLLVGLFGAESKWMGGALSGWMAILAFIFIVIIFGGAAGWWVDITELFDWWDEDTTALLIIILVFGVIIWYVTKPETKGEAAVRTGKLIENIGNIFGGKK